MTYPLHFKIRCNARAPTNKPSPAYHSMIGLMVVVVVVVVAAPVENER